MNGLINVFKAPCITPYQTIIKLKTKYHLKRSLKIGYAGRLDPLASGVLLLMIGNECKNRNFHQAHIKEYNFNLILGIETDSLDPLGLIKRIDHKIDKRSLTKLDLTKFLGVNDQKYPLYSSYHIDGVPMYKLARNKLIQNDSRPVKEIDIHDIKINKMSSLSFNEYSTKVIERIRKINGHFRQRSVIESWDKALIKYKDRSLNIINITTTVSTGTYIRTLCEDIALELDTVGIADNIIRKRVGEYKIEDSLRI